MSCPPAIGELSYRLVDDGHDAQVPPVQASDWNSFQGGSLDLNFTPRTLWVKLEWSSPAATDQKCILTVNYPFLDYFSLYEKIEDEWVAHHTGDRMRDSDAVPYARHPAFVFTASPGPNIIYLRAKTTGLLRLPLEVHPYEAGHRSLVIKSIISAALLGALCLIIAYSLSLFLTTREPSVFFYALFQTCVLYKNACDLGFTRILFPEHWLSWLNNEFYVLDGNAAPLAGLIFSISFLELRKRSRRLYHYGLAGCALALLGLLALPISYRLSALLAIASILLCSTYLTLAGLVLMHKKFRPARYFTLGWLVMVLASVVWGLTNLGMLPYSAFFEWGTAIGAVVEASFTSLALGDKMRYSLHREKHKVKQLNDKLSRLNLNLENEVEQKTLHIRSIMAHIKQGIFTVDRDYRIVQDYSSFLETILERPALQGHSLITALQDIDVPKVFLEKMQATLFMIFDEPQVAFELNQSHLADEVTVRGGKILEFDWYPMPGAEGRIEKMLVSIRDVTEIRRLTLASKSHDEQMTIIAQILANNDHVFEHFIQEAEALLDDCLTLISMPAKRALDEVPVLKINLHTFKGMAHSVNFEAMTQAAHQLEQQLVRWDGTEEAQSILLRHTHELRAMVDHFSDIARTQLGRKLDHSVVQLPAQMVHDWLQNWSDENVHQNLVAISTESLHGIIQGLNRDLKALAPMLGKDVPDIVIEGADERMELRIASKFRHCLLHIVRNALDHGIEPSAERIAQKKKPQGTIRFQIERQQRIVVLTISDDGRGLNLTRIKEKMSHKEATSSPSLETIASWIFLDGVSTANRISHISGRGVGMGAMKHFIEGIGGSIAVSLLSEQTNGYHSFALRITLQHDVLEQPIRIAG
jgi:HPt (histidine-containing phosphotransfer) domain-containing protein/PAS domain-containing protein